MPGLTLVLLWWFAQFEKDDDLDMQFVTAATNLRAHVFSIPLQSQFEIKSIAGNIIPAIATTNAIVAGLQVCVACVACVACVLWHCARWPTH